MANPTQRLSAHFSLAELTHSATAARKGLSNVAPRNSTRAVLVPPIHTRSSPRLVRRSAAASHR